MVDWEMILKFLATFVLAILFGVERRRAHKPVGFGTFAFVAVSSCGLAIAAVSISPQNFLSIVGAIVTGIGFLGAGALMKTTDRISGFTTAAGIWVFAIFGLLVGIGQYIIAGIIYISLWAVILIDKYLESRPGGLFQRRVIIKTNKVVSEKDIHNLLPEHLNKFKLVTLEADKGSHSMVAVYVVEGDKARINSLPNRLYKVKWVCSCRIE